MRAAKNKSRTTWASLVCLASVGCVHQQQTANPRRPMASSQSGSGFQQAGLTSNTGRVAVVNDPSQWPQKPSEAAVKTQFNELFPNLAQRQETAARVQIGPPEAIADVEAKAKESAESLPQVAEASPEPLTPAKPEQPAQPLDSRLMARLSQQSAGAISAVAAMVSVPESASDQNVAATSAVPSPENRAEPLAAAVPSDTAQKTALSSDTKPSPPPTLQTTLDQPAPATAPKLEPTQPSPAEQVAQGVTENKVTAEKPALEAAPAVSQSSQALPEPLPVVPAIPDGGPIASRAEAKPIYKDSLSGPKPTVELPGLNAIQKPAEPVEKVAESSLKDRLEPPAPLPVVPAIPSQPVLTSIPEQPVNKPQVAVKEELPPPLTADEVLARRGLDKKAEAAEPASTVPSEKPLADLPASIPAIPADVAQLPKPLEVPAKPLMDGTQEKVLQERLALAPADSNKPPVQPDRDPVSLQPEPKPAEEPQPAKLPADLPQVPAINQEKAQSPAAVPAPEPKQETLPPAEKAGKPAIDLPPPTPAPELSVPGLPEATDVSANPKPPAAPPADQGVERSSAAAPSESKPAPPVVEAKPQENAESVVTPELNKSSGADTAVPVLTPLPDDQAAVGPKPARSRSREIVIRLTLPKPSLRKLFTAKSESGAQSLRSAAAGMFDWRKRLEPAFNAQAASPETMISQAPAGQSVAKPAAVTGSIADSSLPASLGTKPLLAVAPYQPPANPSQNGLPPVSFPATYRQRPTANPWAHQPSPAVNLVATPRAPEPNPQIPQNQDVAVASKDVGPRPAERSADAAIVPISYATMNKPAAAEISPNQAQVTVPETEKKSWISRAQNGLRSLWGGTDEVVPPSRKDWASRVAAAELPERTISGSNDRLSLQKTAAGSFKALRPPEN